MADREMFADAGGRSKVYTALFSVQVGSSAVGPTIAAVVFALTGNSWRLDTLQRVMLMGMACAVAPTVVLLLFNDDKVLGAESDAHQPLLDEHHKGRGSNKACVSCQSPYTHW